jgi:hypothetical protein
MTTIIEMRGWPSKAVLPQHPAAAGLLLGGPCGGGASIIDICLFIHRARDAADESAGRPTKSGILALVSN